MALVRVTSTLARDINILALLPALSSAGLPTSGSTTAQTQPPHFAGLASPVLLRGLLESFPCRFGRGKIYSLISASLNRGLGDFGWIVPLRWLSSRWPFETEKPSWPASPLPMANFISKSFLRLPKPVWVTEDAAWSCKQSSRVHNSSGCGLPKLCIQKTRDVSRCWMRWWFHENLCSWPRAISTGLWSRDPVMRVPTLNLCKISRRSSDQGR
jgi:hypothetical protein